MICSLVSGDVVSGIFLCSKLETRFTKNDTQYHSLVLTDASGSIGAKCWDIELCRGISVGDAIRIFNGVVSEYGSDLQITIKRPVQVVPNPDLTQLCPSTKYSIESLWDTLQKVLDGVRNEWCKKLITGFLSDPEFKEAFCSNSAAVSVHHDFIGGLLEHTLYVTKTCSVIAGVYQNLNKDLMVTAAFLHDVGKLLEITAFPKNQYSDFGYFVGHVVGSSMIVDKACDKITDFPDDIRLKILHCILAHHGRLEWGSPKLPAIPEAFVLSRIDNLDAKLKIFDNECRKGDWASYCRYLESYVATGAFV